MNQLLILLLLMPLQFDASGSIQRGVDVNPSNIVTSHASNEGEIDQPQVEPKNHMTICEIRDRRSSVVNEVVRTSGNLVTDGLTYTYLEDPACREARNTLQLSSFTKIVGDETVRHFISNRNKKCSKGASAYCFGDVRLSISGRIYEDQEGMLAIEMMHVYEWQSLKD